MVVTFRFLFDECLSKELPALAHSLGFDATHVLFVDKAGASDPSLALYAAEHDYVFVTNNRMDFVRIYARFEVHCGLVVILPNCRPLLQEQLFQKFVAELDRLGDLTNKLIDIDKAGQVTVTEWPPQRRNDTF